jgi:hypothetical protein
MTCGGVSPFGHPGITVRLSTPPGLSQIPTSFIGSRCQGIHRVPLQTSPQTNQLQDARVHYAVPKQQPGLPPPRTHQAHGTGRGPEPKPTTPPRTKRTRACCLRTQQCAIGRPAPDPPFPPGTIPAYSAHPSRTRPPSADVPPSSTRRGTSARATGYRRHPRHRAAPGNTADKLLRKEVIQPHLPVRLPCYDLVPIAGPTFDGSPPRGLGHRLRVLPTFVT